MQYTAEAQNYLQFHFYIEWFQIIEHGNSDLHQRCSGDKIFKYIYCTVGIQSFSSKEMLHGKLGPSVKPFYRQYFGKGLCLTHSHPFLQFGLEYVQRGCSVIQKIDLELQGLPTKAEIPFIISPVSVSLFSNSNNV